MSLADELDAFCLALKRRQLEGSLHIAKRTAELMRSLLTSRRHEDAQALVGDVRSTGVALQSAKPLG